MTPTILLLAAPLLASPPAPPAWSCPCEVEQQAVEWGLARDPLDDMDRFPSWLTSVEVLGWLDGRAEWLDAQIELHGRRGDGANDPYWSVLWAPAVADCVRRRAPWRALLQAHAQARLAAMPPHGPSDAACRRNARAALAELRRLLGDEAYERGVMPGLIDPRFTRPIP